ncbi:MAG: IS66 family insertion sequence element accessory protein TnpB [Nitrososphaera sp.]|nr:IS66 family insertion sequence element accessory protein TnpB [Nitrososphaera sp.]
MFDKRVERILAYREAIDMRKSFDGLLGAVRTFDSDPLSGTLFVFINRRGNYLKSIFWDRTGYCLFAKRLERGRFSFPLDDPVQELSTQVFALLLDGIVLGRRRKMS